MTDRRKSRLIKWFLFVGITLVNVSVFCIWIPALMEVNSFFINFNHIWEHIEKAIFLVVDAGLNFYFLYLVRANLISKGLSKYWPLFKFNMLAVGLSVIMDALLLGMLNLPNSYEYVFTPPLFDLVSLRHRLFPLTVPFAISSFYHDITANED
jgi:hypothetical protein